MAKRCDNTSVGQIIRLYNGDLVYIERKSYPQAYALPAGHVDGDNPWSAGVERECKEEVGIEIVKNTLVFKEEIDNPCKREGGSHHLWEVYQAEEWNGEPNAGDDAKAAYWGSAEKIGELARRTEYFMAKYGIPYDGVGALTRAIFGDPALKNIDPEWVSEMGLEPVWYYILKKLGDFI